MIAIVTARIRGDDSIPFSVDIERKQLLLSRRLGVVLVAVSEPNNRSTLIELNAHRPLCNFCSIQVLGEGGQEFTLFFLVFFNRLIQRLCSASLITTIKFCQRRFKRIENFI